MNKKIKLTILSILALVGLFAGFSTAFAGRTPVVTCNSATIYGSVWPSGGSVDAWLEWGSNRSTVQNGGGTRVGFRSGINYDIEISANISGLSENTTYYYRMAVQDGGDYIPATTESFTTLTCQAQTYTVSTNVSSGSGSFSPTSRQVTSGNTTTFSVTPSSGYTINSVSGCGGYLSGSTFYTGAITSNCTVYADFDIVQVRSYTVTASAGSGGTISPSSRQIIAGYSTTFTVTPYSGYSIDSVTGCNGYLSGSTYHTGAINSNCTVYASFSIISNPAPTTPTGIYAHAISTSQINVSWNPSTGGDGSQIAYNVYRCTGSGCTPNANGYIGWGYQTNYSDTGLLCNTTYGYKVRAYDSSRLLSGYSNTAWATTFACPVTTYTVTASAGSGGTIYPSSRQIIAGYSTTFTVTPYSGYSIDSVTGCNGYLAGNTYTTGAINSNCNVHASFSIISNPNPSVHLTADNTNVTYNGNTTLRWNTTNATSCTASGTSSHWYGNVSISGSWNTGALTNTTTYNITCYGASGTTPATDSVTITVGNQPQTPTVYIYANDTNLDDGDSTYITWSSNNATNCSASGSRSNGWSGSKGLSGSFYTGALYNTTTYNITCTNSTGSADDSVTIYVNDNNDDNDEPDVTTRSATDINDTDAVLNGRVDGNGLSTRAWFEYGTDRGLDDSTSERSYGSGSTNYEVRVSGLDEDTTYYFRAVAENSEGTVYGSIFSFRTDNEDDNDDSDEAPDVTTKNATNVQTGSATLNGRVDGNGLSTRAWFEYGTNTNLGYSTSRTSYGSGSSNYNKTISGLLPNTIYYFRAVAENSEDTVYGNILSFNTTGGFIPVNNQPTVVIYADQTNIAYNGATSIRWGTVSATSCFASNGSIGWAGTKSIGPGSFYTGSLTTSRIYTITCSNNVGSSTDSVTVNVRGQIINPPTPAPTSLVLITSSVDRNQPIVPTIDNTRPKPGDEINYTVSYQNIGTGAITSLTLRMDLPYEVDYMFSNPNNPTKSGNTLIFNLGTLRANGQGVVTVRVRVRDNIPAGTNLNFPAILSYVDPSGLPQSVTANVSAQIWNDETATTENENVVPLGALAFLFGNSFLPNSLLGWLLLILLIVLLILAARKAYYGHKTVVIPNNSGNNNTH